MATKKHIIPGFTGGEVDESVATSLADVEGLKTKAVKMTNFYCDTQDITRRRPPMVSWVDTSLTDPQKLNLIDYIKNDGNEYAIQGPTEVNTIKILQSFFPGEIFLGEDLKTLTGETFSTKWKLNYVVLHVAGKEHVFANITLTPTSGVMKPIEYLLYCDGFSFLNNRERGLGPRINQYHTEYNAYEMVVKKFTGKTYDLNQTVPQRFRKVNATRVGIEQFKKQLRDGDDYAQEVYDINIPDQLYVDAGVVKVNVAGVSCTLSENGLRNSIYRSVLPAEATIREVTTTDFPAAPVVNEVNFDAIRVYARNLENNHFTASALSGSVGDTFASVRSIIGDTTADIDETTLYIKVMEYFSDPRSGQAAAQVVSDNSWADVDSSGDASVLNSLNSTSAFGLAGDIRHFRDPDNFMPAAPLNTRRRYEAMIKVVENLKAFIKPVVSTITADNVNDSGDTHIFPDIKFSTKHTEAQNICSVIYEDDTYYYLTLPEKNSVSVLGTSRVVRSDGTVEPESSAERVPSNAGNLTQAQIAFETLDPTTSRTVEDIHEQKRLENLNPKLKTEKGSWAFSCVPNTDTAAPQGLCATQNSGVGACVALIPKAAAAVCNYNVDSLELELPIGLFDSTVVPATSGTGQRIAAKVPIVDYVSAGCDDEIIIVHLYYDYTHEDMVKWHDDKDCISVTIAEDRFDYLEGKGRRTVTYKKGVLPQMSSISEGMIGRVHSPTRIELLGNSFTSDSEKFRKSMLQYLWGVDGLHSEFSAYKTLRGPTRLGIPTDPNSRSPATFDYMGAHCAPPAPGPGYTRISGEASVPSLYSVGGVPIADFYPAETIDSTVGYRDKYFNNLAGGIMCEFTTSALVHKLDYLPTNVLSKADGRNITHSGSDVFVSEHISLSEKKSNPDFYYLSGSSNVPLDRVERANREIPDVVGLYYPNGSAHILNVVEGIVGVNKVNNLILVSTPNRVFTIPERLLEQDKAPILRPILERGFDTPIIGENTNYYGAQENRVISFKYYERQQGYDGHDETEDVTLSKITQIETMIQRHNLVLCVAGGTNKIHVLRLGGQRRTNSFSTFEFPVVINKVQKLDHDRVLIFTDSAPGVIDFSTGELADYRDVITQDGAVTKVPYSSYVKSTPIYDFSASNFNSVKFTKVVSCMLLVAGPASAIDVSLVSKTRKITNSVGSRGWDGSRFNLINIDKFRNNTLESPSLVIETNSSTDFRFGSIVLEILTNG